MSEQINLAAWLPICEWCGLTQGFVIFYSKEMVRCHIEKCRCENSVNYGEKYIIPKEWKGQAIGHECRPDYRHPTKESVPQIVKKKKWHQAVKDFFTGGAGK